MNQNQSPFHEDQVGLLAEEMQRVHQESTTHTDVMNNLVARVRAATAEQFSAARLVSGDAEVRSWVEEYAREVIRETREQARAAGKPSLRGSDEEIARHVIATILGLGQIETLREIENVEDISINGPNEAYIFRRGKWEPVAGIGWDSEEELLELLNRAIAPTGRQVTPLQPICDAILPGGDRINIVMRPCARPSPCVSIRVRSKERMSFLDLVTTPQSRGDGEQDWTIPDYRRAAANGSMINGVAATFLHMSVIAGLNILVVGPTGVGKTTMLSALGGLIPAERRIVVIEDTPEIRMRDTSNGKPNNCVYFLTRLRGMEGTAAVTQTDLVRASLRQRPDALTLGEARGGEILDMLKALATGHRNGLTSLHAEGVEEVPTRVKQMFQEADVRVGITNEVVARWIAQAFHLVISLGLRPDGRRYIPEILEFSGRVEGDQPARQTLFRWDRDRDGLEWTGMRPARHFLFEERGLDFQTVVDMVQAERQGRG